VKLILHLQALRKLRMTELYDHSPIVLESENFTFTCTNAVKFEVLTAVTMKRTVFWVVTPCT
jgi:hypothetical protein